MYHVFYEGDDGEVVKDLGMMDELPTGKKLRDLVHDSDRDLYGTDLVATQDKEYWLAAENEDGDFFWAET
jgi:hypothetical protein